MKIKVIDFIKNIIHNDKAKGVILLIIGGLILTAFGLARYFCSGDSIIEIVFFILVFWPTVLLIFLPAIIGIYFIFKKNSDNFSRILLTAFIIPFLNLIYFHIESFMSMETIYYSCILGAICLFVIFPSLLLIAICLPKKILKNRREIIITIILTILFGWSFIGLLIPIAIIEKAFFPEPRTYFWNPIIINELEDYRPTINYIEDYKNKKGKYPGTLSEFEPNSKNYPFFTYESFNNNSDYTLSVSENNYVCANGSRCYKYCSSNKLPNCEATGYDENSFVHFKIGDWIFYSYMFDD